MADKILQTAQNIWIRFCLGLDVSTAWNLSKYGVFSGPYFPVFGVEKTPYLETLHAV